MTGTEGRIGHDQGAPADAAAPTGTDRTTHTAGTDSGAGGAGNGGAGNGGGGGGGGSRPGGSPSRRRLLGWAFAMSGLAIVEIVLIALSLTSFGLVGIGLGVPAFLGCVRLVRAVADRHRLWATEVMGIPVPRPYQPMPQGGWGTRFIAVARDRATWRDLWWMFVDCIVGFALCLTTVALFLAGILGLLLPVIWLPMPERAHIDRVIGVFDVTDVASAAYVGIPMGLAYLALWWLVTPWLMGRYAVLLGRLLAPGERDRLARRVQQLTTTRAETVDAQAAELRRIERDLHDGAQARLVALGMSLGMAEEMLARNPETAARMLADARESTGLALSELRDLVRGIHPPVLADRGLAGAVRALALAHPLPVRVEVDLPGRPPAPVESAAYFAVAECLTNSAKYSGATQVWLEVGYDDGILHVLVGDNGRGGATVAAPTVLSGPAAEPAGTAGTGLPGIARRLAAFDGTLDLHSPAGGPTIITMTIPCVLNRPRGPSAAASDE